MHRLTATAVLIVCAASLAAQTPKNIILFIADGAGPAHYTSLKVRRAAEFNIGRMPVTGLATTNCADRYVTDSAAAATALATGFKVNYEAVSQLPDGTHPQTLLELAEIRGKATGLVTTASFFDATPAAFAAHAKHRDEHATIIAQMIASGAEVILGAGLKRITEQHAAVPATAKAKGYTYVTSRAELDAAANTSRVLGVFPAQTRDVDFPDAPLPVLTRFALDRLRREAKGFFLMVEHEGTDSSSHQNHTPDVNASLVSFDTAVGIALDFAAASKDTLVVVTSDHETGGMRVTETKQLGRIRVEWSTTDHTAVSVPVFAFGPGSAAFAGFYDNTDVGKRLLALLHRQ